MPLSSPPPAAAEGQNPASPVLSAEALAAIPAHLAGKSYIINQRSDGKFVLKVWDPERNQWLEGEEASYRSALARVES